MKENESLVATEPPLRPRVREMQDQALRSAMLKRNFTLLMLVVLFLLSGSVSMAEEDPYKEFNSWPPPPKMIAGKPYSITPGTETGTYIVKWGDQQMTWKPKDYMDPTYKKMGPAYYSLWTQKGLPLPWEVPMDQRQNISGADFVTHSYGTFVFSPWAKNYWDELTIKLYLPDGTLRSTTDMMEAVTDNTLGKGASYLDSSEVDSVSRKYVWEFVNPPEVRGEGGVTTTLIDKSKPPQDTLYLPSVQKVRRLAGAVSKQYFPGLIYRYEDVSHVNALPSLNYKVVGFELFDASPDKSMEYKPDHLTEFKRIDGSGDVVAKIEITPKPGVSWWYAKRTYYVGMQTMAFLYDYTEDANGKVLRRFAKPVVAGSSLHMGGPSGPPAPNWYLGWGGVGVEDLDTGYTSDVYPVNGGWNAELPTSMFTDATQYRQPKSLLEWVK